MGLLAEADRPCHIAPHGAFRTPIAGSRDGSPRARPTAAGVRTRSWWRNAGFGVEPPRPSGSGARLKAPASTSATPCSCSRNVAESARSTKESLRDLDAGDVSDCGLRWTV